MARQLLITWALVSTSIAEFSNNTKSLDAQTPVEAKPRRRMTECVDIPPPSWHYLKTCEDELKTSLRCGFRRIGHLDDGLCAKTCGVCYDNEPEHEQNVVPDFGGLSSARFIAVISSKDCERDNCARWDMTRMLSSHRCVHNFNDLFSGFFNSADASKCKVDGFGVLGSYLGQYWNGIDYVDGSGKIRGLNYTDPAITLERLHASACKGLDQIYAARKEPRCGSRCTIAFNMFAAEMRWPVTKRILTYKHTALVIMATDPAIAECRIRIRENGRKNFPLSNCPSQARHAFLHEHRKFYSRLLALAQSQPVVYLQSADFRKNRMSAVHRVLRKAGLHPTKDEMCPPGTFSPPLVCDPAHVDFGEESCTDKWE